jgi:hypothetical protein
MIGYAELILHDSGPSSSGCSTADGSHSLQIQSASTARERGTQSTHKRRGGRAVQNRELLRREGQAWNYVHPHRHEQEDDEREPDRRCAPSRQRPPPQALI